VFLKSLLERVPQETSPEAHALLLSNLAHTKLAYGDLEGTKTDMDAAQALLDSLPSVENRVRADYYKVAADYYKGKADYAPYYRNSLLFLACIELEDLEGEERILRAHDLSISALLGDTIYNFGELVRYNICLTLLHTDLYHSLCTPSWTF
jgi:26S proteasome regulatory subunit N9